MNQGLKWITIHSWKVTSYEDEDCLDSLIKAGIDVNEFTGNGETALMGVAGREHFACVNLLLNAGADVNASFETIFDGTERTALRCAVLDRYGGFVYYKLSQKKTG